MTGSVRTRAPGALVALLLLAALAVLVAARPAAAQGDAEPTAAEQLADRYAPIVVVKDQEEACDTDGEAYRPGPVETVLGSSATSATRAAPSRRSSASPRSACSPARSRSS